MAKIPANHANKVNHEIMIFHNFNANIVKMVSNVHYGNLDESVMKARKKPRLNNHNRSTRKVIWKDDKAIANVEIPQIINDYNYWMLGCDLGNVCERQLCS